MKLFFSLLFICLISFSACEEEVDCRTGILGTYTGTLENNNGKFSTTYILNVGNADKEILMTLQDSLTTYSTVTGILNQDCTVLTFTNADLGVATFSGALNCDGTNIQGSMTSSNFGTIDIEASK